MGVKRVKSLKETFEAQMFFKKLFTEEKCVPLSITGAKKYGLNVRCNTSYKSKDLELAQCYFLQRKIIVRSAEYNTNKHLPPLQPYGFAACKFVVPGLQILHLLPPTFRLHRVHIPDTPHSTPILPEAKQLHDVHLEKHKCQLLINMEQGTQTQ